jgi:hypothetical protein
MIQNKINISAQMSDDLLEATNYIAKIVLKLH